VERITWDKLDHDPENFKEPLFMGENLFGNSAGATSKAAVDAWYSEINHANLHHILSQTDARVEMVA